MSKKPTFEEFREDIKNTHRLIDEALEVNEVDVATALAACMRLITFIFVDREVPVYLVQELLQSFKKACKAMEIDVP